MEHRNPQWYQRRRLHLYLHFLPDHISMKYLGGWQATPLCHDITGVFKDSFINNCTAFFFFFFRTGAQLTEKVRDVKTYVL